jgi:hypothetical protein
MPRPAGEGEGEGEGKGEGEVEHEGLFCCSSIAMHQDHKNRGLEVVETDAHTRLCSLSPLAASEASGKTTPERGRREDDKGEKGEKGDKERGRGRGCASVACC